MANCKTCGKDLNLVGRVHNCTPGRTELGLEIEAGLENAIEHVMEPGNRVDGSTYRYRDPEARRSYMRHYMRKRREDHQH